MKSAYNESCTPQNAALEQELLLYEQAGFDYIELRIDKLRDYLRTHIRDELQSFFRKNRLKPYAMIGMHAYKTLFAADDDPHRQEAFLIDFRFGCEILRAIGARDMVIVPPLFTEDTGKVYDEPWEQRLADNVRIFTYLSALARDYDVRLGIKIIDAPRCSVRTVEGCNAILDAVGQSNVGYTRDPFNFYMAEKDDSFASLVALRPERIFVVHVCGAEGKTLLQSDRTYPDEGVMNVENYLKALRAHGYDGPTSLDISREEEWGKRPERVIARAAAAMKSILPDSRHINQ